MTNMRSRMLWDNGLNPIYTQKTGRQEFSKAYKRTFPYKRISSIREAPSRSFAYVMKACSIKSGSTLEYVRVVLPYFLGSSNDPCIQSFPLPHFETTRFLVES